MTNKVPELLYLLEEDLYRLGNASSSKLDNVRPTKDVEVHERDGVEMVRAGKQGISLMTESRLKRLATGSSSGYAWKLAAHTPIPKGLGLYPDVDGLKANQTANHYLLCPAFDMTLSSYISLLARFAKTLERDRKL